MKKFIGLGADVAVQHGAGVKSGVPDADYSAAGARIVSADEALGADIVLKVRRPDGREIAALKRGALVVAIMDPYGHRDAVEALAKAGVVGLRHGVDAAHHPRAGDGRAVEPGQSRRLPRGDRGGGRIRPRAADDDDGGRHGAGGQGLRHGRRRRRPAGDRHRAAPRRRSSPRPTCAPRPRSRSRSLGAKFVAVEDEEFKQAETAGGYAKEMSDAYKAKQAALVAAHIAKQDIVITTALIPGRPAPRLVTAEMVASMRAGLGDRRPRRRARRQLELAKAGELVTTDNGVKIVGYSNVARLAATASALYARNLYAFVETLIDKANKALAVNWDDELVKATCLTRDGAIVHPNFQPK